MELEELARQLLRQLEAAGHRAVLVGGCVRDRLLGRPIHDYDLATSALPEQVQALFPRSVPTGSRHGTVTVLLDGAAFEVTTFRTDGAYRDGRRPEQVVFVPDLEADLQRRDFTINAMAMDLRGQLFDTQGGKADLRRRRIACVGNPDTRFQEDALRMLRALRFAAQLAFTVDGDTLAAIRRNAPLCRQLSAERVRDELEKTICSPRPQLAQQLLEWGLLEAVGLSAPADLSPLALLPPERLVRWAGFCRAVPAADLRALRLENRAVRLCPLAARAYGQGLTPLQWRCLARDHGWDVAELVAQLNGERAALASVREAAPCVSLAQLAVTGKDFPMCAGPQLGQTLRALLDHVLGSPQDNEKEILLRFAKEELGL